jgi:hypothetical protein
MQSRSIRRPGQPTNASALSNVDTCRDLIRVRHYGQRSCERHQQAGHIAAPTSGATSRFSLPIRSRPHMALKKDAPIPRDVQRAGRMLRHPSRFLRNPAYQSASPPRRCYSPPDRQMAGATNSRKLCLGSKTASIYDPRSRQPLWPEPRSPIKAPRSLGKFARLFDAL